MALARPDTRKRAYAALVSVVHLLGMTVLTGPPLNAPLERARARRICTDGGYRADRRGHDALTSRMELGV